MQIKTVLLLKLVEVDLMQDCNRSILPSIGKICLVYLTFNSGIFIMSKADFRINWMRKSALIILTKINNYFFYNFSCLIVFALIIIIDSAIFVQ
jgi:hypothetical protein